MADLEYNVIFNFNFNASGSRRAGQTLTRTSQENVMHNTFNYVIEDIAFYAARRQQVELRNNIESQFRNLVARELAAMGRKITSQAVGIGSRQRGPLGRLQLEGPVSETFGRLGLSQVMNLQSYTGAWAERSRQYLARKRRKFGHTKWFYSTRQLRDQLRNASLYTNSYGPVRVKFDATQLPTRSQAVERISNLTATRGRSQRNISVGRLEVSVLGRITEDMLADPDGHSFDSRFNGLFEMLPDEVAVKLAGPNDHRPIIEPFLSFYLTRQIPNKVFKALEDSTTSRFSGLTGSRVFRENIRYAR